MWGSGGALFKLCWTRGAELVYLRAPADDTSSNSDNRGAGDEDVPAIRARPGTFRRHLKDVAKDRGAPADDLGASSFFVGLGHPGRAPAMHFRRFACLPGP